MINKEPSLLAEVYSVSKENYELFVQITYEKIYNSAQSFFIKPDYDPLYPEQNINLIYFESQDENLSIYLDTQMKQLYFAVSY